MGKVIYFPSLNGLRFFAALSVIISHFYSYKVLAGHYGVVLFFTLSGFLITYLLLEEKEKTGNISIKKFYYRRILRIWPLYFLIIILAPAIAIFFNSSDFCFTNFYKALPLFLFFMPNIAYALGLKIGLIDVLWSIGSEEQFYLFWPWIMKYSKRETLLKTYTLIILFFLLAPYILSILNKTCFPNNDFIFFSKKILYRMGFNSMATGAIFAFLYKFKRNYLKFFYSSIVQFLSLSMILVFWVLNVNIPAPDQIFSLLFSIIIINLSTNKNSLFSLENRIFNYLGKISYGLYVYHIISFFICGKLFIGIKISNHFLFLIGLLLTILLSTFSYYFFEKKFLKIKQDKYSPFKTGTV